MEQKRQSSMVYTCKEKNCGRTFEDHTTFKQHMKKRHQKESSTDDTSTLAQSMITELNEIQALKDTVYELTSELKQETESDSQVYARSILEIELEKKKQEKKSLISFETVEEAKLCLTDDFVTEAAKKSSENDDVHSLELFEVLSMNKMNLTYFDKTEQFSPDRLRSLKRIDLSYNSLLSATGMTHLYNIEIINLSHNCISSLEGLEDCSTLKQLNLENNFLVSCHELKSLNELEHLNLAFNKIKDLPQTIEMIQNLSKLKELWFKGNPVLFHLTRFQSI